MANKDGEVHGYSLTHRLLYLQVARQVSRDTLFTTVIEKYACLPVI
jgi:hypothetical protein